MSEDGRQYLPMYFDFVESKAFTNLSGNALKLYLRLRRYVCRACSGHSLSDFYIKGYLATSGYLEQHASAFNVSRSTISRWLRELEDSRFIITYRKAEKGRNEPNIWLLGRVTHYEGSQYGSEAFFADHEAMAQEQDIKATEAFDQSKASALIASMTDNLTVSYLQQLTEQPAEQLAEPSNREDLIEKTNREENNPSSQKSELDEHFPRPGSVPEEPTAEDEHRARVLEALRKNEVRGDADNWAVPAEAGGADDWAECVGAFAEHLEVGALPLPTRQEWSRALQKVGRTWQVGPRTVEAVIRKLPQSQFHWKTYNSPHQAEGDLGILIGQYQNGGVKLPRNKGNNGSDAAGWDAVRAELGLREEAI